MQLDYAIEEMLLQSPNLVVYKARGRNGFRYAISRFIFPKSVLANLKEACFDSALGELKRLNHGCLRPVIDGGLDAVDGMPWVARVWWDGEYLEDRINNGVLTPFDIQRLVDHGQALIDALGDRAAAVSFRARDVILTSGRGGQPVETFNVDVQNWFRDWAMGIPPGAGKNARAELSNLVTEAENSEVMPMMAMPEEEPVVRHRQLVTAPTPSQPLIPAPTPSQLLVPAPAPSQMLMPAPGQQMVPAPTPSQALIPAPTPSQHMIPAPTPSQYLVPAPTPSQQLVQGPTPSQALEGAQGHPTPTSKLIFQTPTAGRRLKFQ